MALRINLVFPKFHPQRTKLQSHPFFITTRYTVNPAKSQISCKRKSISDAKLAADLAAEVERINALLAQREEALEKSRELLFSELCNYAGLNEEEMKGKWKRMSEDEIWVLVKGFVSDWSDNFHPLSARSVKELVDEYLVEYNTSSSSSMSQVSWFEKFFGIFKKE